MQVSDKKGKSDWESVQLEEICSFINGKTPLKSKNEYWENGTVPWFTIEDIRNQGRLIGDTAQYITKKALDETGIKVVPKNSVLLCCTASIGEYAKNKIPLTTNQQFNALVIKDNDKICSEYLFSVAPLLKKKLQLLMGTTTFGFVSLDKLGSIKIFLPPLPEQRKIAAILSTVDEDIEKTDNIIEQTEKLKRGLMQKLLTKGIGYKKFKKTKLGEIPEEWEVVKIKDSGIKLIDGDRGVNYPKLKDFSTKGYCLFLSNKNIKNNKFIFDQCSFVTKEKDEALRKGKLKRGDIVLTTRGTVGHVAYYNRDVPYNNIRINSGMLIFRCTDNYSPLFLYKLFSSSYMKDKFISMGSGSAQPQLPIGSLKIIDIVLPPIREQKIIAQMAVSIDKKIDTNNMIKKELTLLKKGLMQDLLSGKVRVKT